jgi:hypothetical protein
MEDSKYCTKDCKPEYDEHSEECIKRWVGVQKCVYCLPGDNCMICGRHDSD